jgi:hypothetical protein
MRGEINVRKYLPTENDVHVDRPLTNFSVASFQEESVHLASSCFPVIPVNNQTDKYYVWNRGDLFRDEARVRAPGTPVIRTGARLSTDSYYCAIYELGDIIPDEVRKNSDPGTNLEQHKVRTIIQKLLIKRERIFASNFLATGKWTTDITGATITPATNEVLQWANASSTPIDDVYRGKERILKNTGKRANTLVLTTDVHRVLSTNAQVLARLTGGQTPGGPAMISDADLAKVFGVDRILVSEAVYNSAKEGATASMGFVATRKALLLYSDPNPGLDSETAGATFVWANSGFGNRVGVQINMQRDNLVYSDLIDGFMNFDQKLTSADMGYFFNNIISATA